MIRTARATEQDVLPRTSNLVFAFSWMLVMAIGLMPLAEASLHRSPSITLPTAIAFFVAMGSATLLQRRYAGAGLVLHIYGQIAIWLSLFVMSLAIVLYALGST